MKKRKHILFIGHEASLSGAPILLLNLMLLLQQKNEVRITLVIRRGGPLLQQYRQHFPVIVLKPAGYRQGGLLKKMMAICLNRLQLLRLFFVMPSCNGVFSNTIINGPLLKTLSLFNKPVITYVHELENVMRVYPGEFAQTVQYTRLFAYPSFRVKEALAAEGPVPADRLQKLSYYFPVNRNVLTDEAAKHTFAESFKKQFGLESSDMLVSGMGVASGRKGTDLFIEVCAQVARVNKQIRFCWIGNFDTPATEAALKARVAELDIREQLIFTGPLPHHYYNLAAFDLFFLSSREDPYPLVVLEAGFMQVPAICFEQSGGIPEFVGDDAGWIVPGLSTEQAAQTILLLQQNKAMLREKGACALQKSLQLHANEALILQQFSTLVQEG